jgi:hypothetical protein
LPEFKLGKVYILRMRTEIRQSHLQIFRQIQRSARKFKLGSAPGEPDPGFERVLDLRKSAKSRETAPTLELSRPQALLRRSLHRGSSVDPAS